MTDSKSGKEYNKAVYCHLVNAYIEYTMQNVKLNYKPESRFPGEISTTSDMQMIPLLGLGLG